VEDYFSFYSKVVKDIFNKSIEDYGPVKTQMSLVCEFIRKPDFGYDCETSKTSTASEYCPQYINANMKILLNMFYFKQVYSEVCQQVTNIVNIFEQNGSGWILNRVLGSDIRIVGFDIFKGGCFMPVPRSFRYKRTIINPQNSGKDCFKWAFLSIAHYKDVQGSHRERYLQYRKFEHRYNFECMNFPASMKDVEKFEKWNSDKNFAINVFGVYEQSGETKLSIKYVSRFVKDKQRKVVNLLYVQEVQDHIGHYMGIVDINKLLGKSNHHKHFLCYNCLHLFTSETKLSSHEELCHNYKSQIVEYPTENINGEKPCLEFTKFQHKLKAEYVIYADFEALLLVEPQDKLNENKTVSEYQSHQPCGYGFVVVNSKQELIYKKLYRGTDCVEHFLKEVSSVCSKLVDLNKNQVPMRDLTDEEALSYNSASFCHICEKKLRQKDKVRDHNWSTGFFRGPAHRTCNAKYRQKEKIPILIHNFKNYDQHLLLANTKRFPQNTVKTIPFNSEKFLSVICDDFYFLDSMMFLATSLDELVKNLKNDYQTDEEFEKRFNIMVQFFGLDLSKLLSRKGVYPYEYMNSWTRFEETNFPDKKEFYSSLHDKQISDEDYDYGKKIFKSLCTNIGDYHDIYLMTDCLLLACVFENFRTIALKNYKLEPCYYFSLAGYCWDAALFKTKQKLELITNSEIYNTIESGLRGGISIIARRHATAFNKYMPEYEEGKEKDRYLFYIDKCNLYGETLLQPLPTRNFEFEDEDFVNSITSEVINSWKDDDKIGRFLVVDLKYPKKLHLDHDEYPLMPEKIPIKKKQLSEYQTNLLQHFGISYSENQNKLVPHLGNRYKYVVHYRNLKYYLSKGVKLMKVHKVIRFQQEAWLKDYILFNSELRKSAKNVFEKNLYKFFINSIFGRSMMQKRNREDAIIICNQNRLKYLVGQSTFKHFQIISQNLVIVYMKKPKVVLDSAIFTAMAVLDLSKLFMYQWHYDKIKKWYGTRAKFLFTDTDSLAYLIYTEDLYRDISKYADDFDFSDYPVSHFLHSSKNKKVIGKMTDEAQGKILKSFIGVAPKLYSFEGIDIQKRAAKGVKKSVIKNHLKHEIFYKALYNQKKFFCSMNLIRSKRHRLTTNNMTKVALHCFDSKRFILNDGIRTLAHNSCYVKLLKRL